MANKVQSDKNKIQSGANKVQSDANKAQSEANKALSLANKVQSDANKVQSDKNKALSMANQVQSDTNKAQSLANKALSMKNSNKLSAIDYKVILDPFERVVQYDVLTGQWGKGVYTVTMESVPLYARFILVDVFLNDANNEHWTLTFSEDEYTRCDAYNYPPNGGPPNSNFNSRTQTVSIAYNSFGHNAFPRYGQWT